MFRSLFKDPKDQKIILVPPQELANWIENKVHAHVPRTLIYKQLLHMQPYAANPQLYRMAAKDVMAVMLIRNHRGTKLELAGQIEAAIAEYEANVRDLYEELYPYYRLRLIYEQRKDYQNALRICEACLRLPVCLVAQYKESFASALQQFKANLGPQERV